MGSVGPRARSDRLVTRSLGNELLVYDLERHKAYCLNQMAMEVFRLCDGKTTIPAMAVRVSDVVGVSVAEDAVRLGLARLNKAHLLDGPANWTKRRSRRDMLRTIGRATALAVPLVTALSVPTTAHAASCGCRGIDTGQPCHGCMGTCGYQCRRFCSGTGNCR